MHPAYDIYFVYFKPDSPSRVVKFAMTDMHKIEQGGIYMGDPMKMSPALGIPQAEKWYEFFTGKKKKFDTPKCGQFALYKVLMKKAIPFTEEDMKKSYRTQVEIPKPNNYCNVVTARDPYDTSQKLTRTDKVPMSAKNKKRMKQYEGIKNIQDVLDKGVLNLNDIKYDIKLGYVKKG
jgi:hypothetical protein